MKFTRIFVGTLALLAGAASARSQVSTSNKWWAYMADYNGTPGSTRVDMALQQKAPVQDLPFVVIAGTKYTTTLASGLPEANDIQRLNELSDKLILAIMSVGPSLYVGTFTHNNEQVHYVFVKDLAGTEEAFKKALKLACNTCEASYRTKSDPDWNTYLKFLYPNQATMQFYGFDPTKSRTYKQ